MSDLSDKHLIVTGASGYIGARLCELALAEGATITALGRKPVQLEGVKFVSYELGQDVDAEVMQGADAVIHLAVAGLNTETVPDINPDINVVGTRKLAGAAQSAGVPNFVYISSQSAKPDAPTQYGRDKWAVEQILGATILRPGLVYGRAEKSTYGSLCALIKASPILPIIGANEPVQPIYIDTFCDAILKASLMTAAAGQVYQLGAPEPIRFEDFLKRLAKAKYARRCRVVKVPLGLALIMAKISSVLPGFPTIHSDRLKGLQDISVMTSAEDMAELDLEPENLEKSLAQEGGGTVKYLRTEANVLLRYITGSSPRDELAERYVQALLAIEDHRVLQLPFAVKKWPRLLCFIDPLKKNVDAPGLLADRLEVAVRIAEATPEHTSQFMNLKRRPVALVAVTLAWIGFIELIALPFRALFSRREP